MSADPTVSPVAFPSPTEPDGTTADVFLRYLDFFRATVVQKLRGLDETQLRTTSVPSGWTPLELLKHLVAMEQRWLVWGFAGQDVGDAWFDRRDHRWFVGEDETVADLVARLDSGGRRTRQLVQSHALSDVGEPGPRWDGKDPATLERVLFHVLQEYARHVGHLDIVRELTDGSTGE
jgi:uncharacterized damage-inducible protein DinB